MPTAAVSNKLLKCKPNRKHVQFETLNSNNDPSLTFFFFFITREPRVVRRKSLSLKYEPSSEPLHISAK